MEYIPIALPLFYYKKPENGILHIKLMAERNNRALCFSFIVTFFKIIYLFFVTGMIEEMLSIMRGYVRNAAENWIDKAITVKASLE